MRTQKIYHNHFLYGTYIVQIKLQNKQLQFDNCNNTKRFILKEAAHDLMSKESGFNLYLIKLKKKKKLEN